jgi:hypothetical protein
MLRDLSPAQLACQDAGCVEELGRSSGGSHVLLAQVSYGRESYKLRLELWQTGGASPLGTRERECELCTANDLMKALRDSANLVCAPLATAELAPAELAPAEPTSKVPLLDPISTGDSAATAAPPLHDTPELAAPRRSLWPWLLLGTGAAALGAGVTLWAVDGCVETSTPPKPAPPVCQEYRRTRVPGFAVGAAGLAALAGGGLWLVLRGGGDQSTITALGIGPGEISMRGRF